MVRNTEWDFIAYSRDSSFKSNLLTISYSETKRQSKYRYIVRELRDHVSGSKFSTIELKLAFERNNPYYTMTLILPIVMLTIMAPLGLILPVESGEKMGFQVTLLLTVVIYVEYLQNNIPVFDTLEDSPYLLRFFVVMIFLIATSIVGRILFCF